MTDDWHLDTLPTDVLILIFNYCHAFDLVRLSEVCKRFYELVRNETLWIKKTHLPIVTNQCSRKFRNRCNPLLSHRKKWHVSYNWKTGRYEKKVLFSQRAKLMPWIQLTEDVLWWSGGNHLYGFSRREPFQHINRVFSVPNTKSDVCKFVVRDEYILSGHRDGSIKFWLLPPKADLIPTHFDINRAHQGDVCGIDETANKVVVSGASDGLVKFWNRSDTSLSNIHLSATVNVRDRVWSLAADPLGQRVAVGSSGNRDNGPLHIYDIECYDKYHMDTSVCKRGAGILDMLWDNPQTLLTCGYDTCIRKWDMRTGKCEMNWSDPTDATLYCISSDYQYTMLSGTQFNCKAVLWDQRYTTYIQLYFMNLRRISSPVYCIGFDSCHLYGATDQHLVELTFSGYSYTEKNYRKFLQYDKWPCNMRSANGVV